MLQEASEKLKTRAHMLLELFRSDLALSKAEQWDFDSEDLRKRLAEIKNMLPNPNMLLLCGGIAPEVTVHKRLGLAPLGTVILQDTDLTAVGVAVAAHPDVEFAIVVDDPKAQSKLEDGDVNILAEFDIFRTIDDKTGGIHGVGVSNPCQEFSRANPNRLGLDSESARLILACSNIIDFLKESSSEPMVLYENVKSTKDIEEQQRRSVKARYFEADASMCGPSFRTRRFATNRPPPRKCGDTAHSQNTMPPSLNGDLPEYAAASVLDGQAGGKYPRRMLHPHIKKLNTIMHSNMSSIEGAMFVQDNEREDPEPVKLTAEEVERAMGYRGTEIGKTSKSAKDAVEQRIKEHDYERDGPLVSLKGCAKDFDNPSTELDDETRIKLLGNSINVTMLEILMWNDRKLFPPILK